MVERRGRGAFVRRMAELLRVREQEVGQLLRGARATTVRVNRLHTGTPHREVMDELVRRLGRLEPVPWCPDAYHCPAGGCGPAVPMAERGQVYLQNAASLIPVVGLDPRPGETILDVAAAPGGKAFHIAARVGNDCQLWLNDAMKVRAEKLRALAALYQVQYARITVEPAQYLDKSLPAESFDRILLDVQCSGEGRIDLRRSDALRHWSPERIEKYKYLQTRMLAAAYRLLRPGGTMVYSTCTISPEENEFPVSQILRRHRDLDLAPLELPEPNLRGGLTGWRDQRFDSRLAQALRVVPTDAFEGFFAAKLVRAG